MTRLRQTGPALRELPPDQEIARIAAFVKTASIELTRPNAADFADARAAFQEGTPIYLTAVPGRPLEELRAATLAARQAGFQPVPHVAARHFEALDQIEQFLSGLIETAAVDQIMLIGGDSAPRPEAVADALTVIASGLLQRLGIRAIGLAAFPDGHPALTDEELELSLVTKIAAAQSAGLEAHVVTQFCFDAQSILRWLEWLRERGVQAPVRVGFAGPTSLMSWLNYARRCGVRASGEALAARSGLARHAFRTMTPDLMVRAVAAAAADGRLGDVRAHFFAFGSARATAHWAASVGQGDVSLGPDGGFELLR